MTADTLVAVSGALRDLSLAGVAGALLLIAAVLPKGGAAADRAAVIGRIASIVWVATALTYSFATYAVIRDSGVDPNRFLEEWWNYSNSVELLQAHRQVIIAALVSSVLVALVRGPLLAGWSLIPVAWAVGWQAQTGHAAGSLDHHLATSSMALHIAGAAIWVGVIGVVASLRHPLGDGAKDAISRASKIAIWGAILVTVSGAANAWLRLESLADLFTTTYGALLTAKIVLMAGAIALAAWHRARSLPRLSEADAAARFWRVLAVDVVALVAIMSIAGVLSTVQPPVRAVPVADPSPAYYLTGYALPPQPSAWNWIALWRLEIIAAFVFVAALVVYVRWAVRLRKRGDAWPVYRVVLWVIGIGVLLWVSQGAPAIYGMTIFSGHMVEHMVLVTVAPIFLALAAPITLALRALPVRHDGSRGSREWLRGLVESRFMAFVSHPVVAAASFAAVLILFYYSPVFEFTLRNHAGHLWMLFHFAIVGYLFVNALIGVDPGPSRPRYPMRIVLLFATMAAHAFFGVVLTESEVLLAPTWYGLMGRTWGPDAITDQQYGGQLAWGMGELPVVLLAILVVTAWRQADARETARSDRKADRDHDADLKAYNEMLARVARDDREQGL
jgi:cytochrome c oxidase assembly factor CtaG/putative copper export protein